jgi:hypothetical protein
MQTKHMRGNAYLMGARLPLRRMAKPPMRNLKIAGRGRLVSNVKAIAETQASSSGASRFIYKIDNVVDSNSTLIVLEGPNRAGGQPGVASPLDMPLLYRCC